MQTTTLPFNSHVAEYEQWFEKYPHVFKTELQAIKELMPLGDNLKGLEIGVATGRFAKELKIHDGVEPAENMRQLALKRGIHAVNGVAESLPYKGLTFDFVLMNFCVSYFNDPLLAFRETWRVLKYGGSLIIGFLEKNSFVARQYQRKKTVFYNKAHFYSSEEIQQLLMDAGFHTFEFSQIIFHQPETINAPEQPLPGFGKGAYIMLKTVKPLHPQTTV